MCVDPLENSKMLFSGRKRIIVKMSHCHIEEPVKKRRRRYYMKRSIIQFILAIYVVYYRIRKRSCKIVRICTGTVEIVIETLILYKPPASKNQAKSFFRVAYQYICATWMFLNRYSTTEQEHHF
jgi:hypothetical protein